MTTYTTGRDVNGNKVCRVKPAGGRGFSIQTNGNLPLTDREGIVPGSKWEIRDWVRKYGTKRQRELLGIKRRKSEPVLKWVADESPE